MALAELRPEEDVLDRSSGDGPDLLLGSWRVGLARRVCGLDQSEEMLALAANNIAEAGVENVVLLLWDIEALPLPRASVDLVTSNCVINVTIDKAGALKEALRVLRPGGQFAVSEMVLSRPLPAKAEHYRKDLAAWSGCAAGALAIDEYGEQLSSAGFSDIEVEVRGVFSPSEQSPWGSDYSPEERRSLDGILAAASIRTLKPESES